jgi:hypothetical protein
MITYGVNEVIDLVKKGNRLYLLLKYGITIRQGDKIIARRQAKEEEWKEQHQKLMQMIDNFLEDRSNASKEL